MKVHVPEPLRSYTARREWVEAGGASVAELLADLDRQFPGLRFRVVDEQDGIRPHMRIFVNQVQVRSLEAALGDGDEVHLLQALSGG